MLSFAAVHLLKPTQKNISKTLVITTTTNNQYLLQDASFESA